MPPQPSLNSPSGPSPNRGATLVVFFAVLGVLSFLNLLMVQPYLIALAMGLVLSVLARPLYQLLRRRRLSPYGASFLTTLGLLLLVVGPLTTFAVLAFKQAVLFAQKLAQSQSFSLGDLLDRITHWAWARRIFGNPEAIQAQLTQALQSFGRAASGEILAVMKSLPDQVLQGVLSLITCFFLLVQGKRVRVWLVRLLPFETDVRQQLMRSFQDTAVSVILATLVTASVQSGLMGLGFLLLKVPLPFLAAGCTFVFAWIPVIGSTPVWLTGALYLYVQGRLGPLVMMLLLGTFVGLIDNVIRPWILRGRTSMHPLVGLIAMIGGLQFFGLAGVFFGPILTALWFSLLESWAVVGQRLGVLPSAGVPAEQLAAAEAGVVPGLTRAAGRGGAEDQERKSSGSPGKS